MTSKTRVPSISLAGIKDHFVRKALEPMKEAIDVLLGQRGNDLDRAVRLRDFTNDDLALGIRRGGGLSSSASDLLGGTSAITPRPLSNLTANGALESVILRWEGSTQTGYSYTEIWRAAVDDLGQAELIGTAVAAIFADDVGPGVTNYYWIRAVSISGHPGAFNATAGTPGQTGQSPDAVRDLLTSRAWAPETAYFTGQIVAPDTEVRVNDTLVHFQVAVAGASGATEPNWASVTAFGDQITDGGITWVAVESGRAPFIVGEVNGEPIVFMHGAAIKQASIESASIKSLAADKIVANELAAISANLGAITAGSLNINNRFIVDANGNTVIRSATTGARVETRNNVIKVFDANGTLRVRIGDLGA